MTNLSASGRLWQVGDTWEYWHNGTRERKTHEGVVLEIFNLKKWREYKAAVKRKTKRELQDLPLAPEVVARQQRAKLNLGDYQIKPQEKEKSDDR